MIGGMFGTLKFVAAAKSEETIVTPRVTMKKGFDGRWLNLLIGWSLTMCLVQRVNKRRASAARLLKRANGVRNLEKGRTFSTETAQSATYLEE